jgi:DNA-binding CsgD family transcriptional regulator
MPELSPRKLQIMELTALGKTDPEISAILGIGEPTVRTHMCELRHRFDVYSRTQLATAALQFGIVSFDDALPWSDYNHQP